MATQFDKFTDRNNFKFNLIESAELAGRYGLPKIKRSDYLPTTIIPFNYAKTEKEPSDKCVHFFIDDFQFERLWNFPNRYIDLLKRFEGVITPDFSMYDYMSEAQIIWNCYRNRVLAFWMQRNGINIVPTIEWSKYEDLSWCLEGIPKNSNIAIGTYGSLTSSRKKYALLKGIERIVIETDPRNIICYGPKVESVKGICNNVIFFENYSKKMKKTLE